VLSGGLAIESILFFWTDTWLCGVPLSVLYKRLFDLSTNQSVTVVEMSELGWEEGGAAWQ
jgi:hypothetical protein